MMKTEKLETAKEFAEDVTSRELIISALTELSPKNSKVASGILAIISLTISWYMSYYDNTVEMMFKSTSIILTIQLAVFGCVFTIYSIILAFFNTSIIEKLSCVRDQNKSFLKKYTGYYESILFLSFFTLSITGVLAIVTSIMPREYSLTNNLKYDELLAFVFSTLYFYFSFRVFYELKSTIFNTVTLFRASIADRLISAVREEARSHNNDDDK